VAAWEKIKWADHLVWVYPVWWGSWPALMKGFVDRVFLPGLTFKKIEGSLWWEKLLKGKTARIITTMDQPGWYYRWVYGRPSTNALKKCTLEFCGVGPVKTTTIGPIRNSKTTFRENWLEKVKRLGQNMD
jgi:NAD(P)H dehydrogenase (quinone)